MSNTTPAERGIVVLALALAVLSGAAVAQTPNAPQSHAMTSTPPASDTLSARQQAIPLIASFMAASDMGKLNAALNQGLEAASRSARPGKCWCSSTPTSASRKASTRWANC